MSRYSACSWIVTARASNANSPLQEQIAFRPVCPSRNKFLKHARSWSRGAKSGGPPSLPRATPDLGKIIAYRQTDRATQSEALLQRIAAPIWISLLSPPALPAPRGRRCKIPAASKINSQDRPQRAFESATELCYCRISRVPRAGHEQVAKEISDASEPVRRRTFAGEAFAR